VFAPTMDANKKNDTIKTNFILGTNTTN